MPAALALSASWHMPIGPLTLSGLGTYCIVQTRGECAAAVSKRFFLCAAVHQHRHCMNTRHFNSLGAFSQMVFSGSNTALGHHQPALSQRQRVSKNAGHQFSFQCFLCSSPCQQHYVNLVVIADASHSRDYKTWLAWGVLERRRRNVDAARECFAHAARIAPTNPHIWYAWAMMEARDVRDVNEARRLLERGTKLCPR